MTRSADIPNSVEELENRLSQPPDELIEMLAALDGDLILLGAGGKMGPTLARMAKRGFEIAGLDNRVIAVSRFSDTAAKRRLNEWGVETIACDLLEESSVAELPQVENVIAMTGMKFGASQNPELTWAMNCLLPAFVCNRYRSSRIVAFSSGNVYGPVPLSSLGSRESDPPRPDGEYAMTVLGRERMYEYFSCKFGNPTAILRLNYATELRYGVLVDIGKTVFAGKPVSLRVPRVNVIWQADANAMALTALARARSPALVVNVAGTELLDVEETARRMGELMGKPVQFHEDRGELAFLNDGRAGQQLLGNATETADELIRWTADWVSHQRHDWNKPTHFQVTSGNY